MKDPLSLREGDARAASVNRTTFLTPPGCDGISSIFKKRRISAGSYKQSAEIPIDGVPVRLTARAIQFMECSNPCPPESTSNHVLLRVPESTFVHGIDIHRAVIAPSRGDGLRAGAVNKRHLARKGAGRISGRTSCVANLREYTAARDAVTQRDAAEPIHRNASHPTM